MDSTRVVSELTHIVEELGDICISIADNYPRFFSNLDEEFEEFLSLGDSLDENKIREASRSISVLFEQKDRLIEENGRKETELYKTVEGELDKLAGMEKEIDGIEECSEDLELISLNAMVSALKAGNNGGAFPYITRELQRVSRLSAKTSSLIRDQGSTLDREYKRFIDEIRESQEGTGRDIGEVFEALGSAISSLEETGRDFSRRYETLQSSIDQMKTSVYMVIEEVQTHDIVRQSVDHIILSLGEIEHHGEEEDLEGKLNNLKFTCQVYELSRFIIEDIQESVQRSFDRFSAEKERIKEVFHGISIENDDESGEKFLALNPIRNMEKSLTDNSLSEEKRTDDSSDLVSRLIDDLDDGIERFSKVLNTIRNIHVASRIEVVKLNRLENMDNIISGIDETVGQMNNLLEEISGSVTEFRKASREIVSEFQDYFFQVNSRLETIFSQIDPILRSIEEYQISLNEQMSNLAHISADFNVISRTVDEHLEKMASLIKDINGMSRLFESRRLDRISRFQEVLKESPYDQWTLQGDGITKLIDKFTIFIHKKKLTESQEFSDIDLDDEQAQASEITLF